MTPAIRAQSSTTIDMTCASDNCHAKWWLVQQLDTAHPPTPDDRKGHWAFFVNCITHVAYIMRALLLRCAVSALSPYVGFCGMVEFSVKAYLKSGWAGSQVRKGGGFRAKSNSRWQMSLQEISRKPLDFVWEICGQFETRNFPHKLAAKFPTQS